MGRKHNKWRELYEVSKSEFPAELVAEAATIFNFLKSKIIKITRENVVPDTIRFKEVPGSCEFGCNFDLFFFSLGFLPEF
jgi:hypothetical protein